MPRSFTGTVSGEIALATGGVGLGIVTAVIGERLVGGPLSLMLTKILGKQKHLTDFILGGINGAIAKTICAPIDRIKLMLQYDDDPEFGELEPLNGALDCAQRIYARDGWRGFWKGNTVNCLRYMPTQAFNFAFKDLIKQCMKKLEKRTPAFFGKKLVFNTLGGGISAILSLSIVYPLDLARSLVMLAKNPDGTSRYASFLEVFTDIVKSPKDVVKLYKGLFVSVVGIIPFRALYFTINDTLRAHNPYQKDKGIYGLVSKFMVAQCASQAAFTRS